MTSVNFCYWLQGYLEISGESKAFTKEQVKCIQNHLNLVFKHEIDPSHGDETHLEELQAIHDGDSEDSSNSPKRVDMNAVEELVRRTRRSGGGWSGGGSGQIMC